MKLKNQQLLVVMGAGGLLLWYLKNKAATTAKEVGQAINPVNDDNVFYQGVNAVGESLTGDEHFTLGGWLYDKLN